MAGLPPPLAIGPRSPSSSRRVSGRIPRPPPPPPAPRPQAPVRDPGLRAPSPSPAPFLRQAPAMQWPVSGALSSHLHGDAPALHGGEAVGQREARGANPVPGALHRVGLREVGTHGGGWPAARGAGERDATLAGAGAGAPGARVAGSGPGCTADARCRRKARGRPGGGNGTGAGRERKRKPRSSRPRPTGAVSRCGRSFP